MSINTINRTGSVIIEIETQPNREEDFLLSGAEVLSLIVLDKVFVFTDISFFIFFSKSSSTIVLNSDTVRFMS